MIQSKTPFRIGLFGGGCDSPSYFKNREKTTLTVGALLDKHCYISLRPLPKFFDYKSRIVYSKIETVKTNQEIEHRAVKAALNVLKCDLGLEIIHMADLPGNSGLGGSSSFLVGLLKSLLAMKGQFLEPKELAKLAIKIEREIMAEPGGWYDEIMAAMSHGLSIIKFYKDGDFDVIPLALTKDQILVLQSYFMLFFIPGTRKSGEISKSYIDVEQKRHLKDMIQVITEEGINALYGNKWEKVGDLLDKSWQLKRSLSPEISNIDIDKIYNSARIAGALGGRLCGAGSNGAILLFVPPDKQDEVRKSINLLEIPFKFSYNPSEIIFTS